MIIWCVRYVKSLSIFTSVKIFTCEWPISVISDSMLKEYKKLSALTLGKFRTKATRMNNDKA